MRQALRGILLVSSFILFLISLAYADMGQIHTSDAKTSERVLKENCINAVIKAIGFEIKRFEFKLDASRKGPGDPANVPVFEKRIAALRAEREKYRALDPEKYTLPEKRKVTGKVRDACKGNTILELDSMSRSGPFYHIAGVGGDCKTIKPGKDYTMTLYLVYPRDYPFTSAYVYLDRVE